MTSSYYSKTFKTGDGTTTEFLVDFLENGGDLGAPWLSSSHIKIYINGVAVSVDDYTVTKTPSPKVTLTTPPANGDVVLIARETPKLAAERIINFTSGAVLTEDSLDKSAVQSLFITQESLDSAVGGMGLDVTETKWDARGQIVTDGKDPIATQDLATKQYVDTAVLFPDGGGFTDPQMWELVGDGVVDTFLLSSPTPNSTADMMYIVDVDGIGQVPRTADNNNDFDIVVNVNQTVSIVFQAGAFLDSSGVATSSPPSGAVISVRNFGITRNVLGSHIIVESDSTTDVTLGAKGISGQTANIIEGQDETGTTKFGVSSAGATTVNSLTSASIVSAGGAISTTSGDISTASGAITGTGAISGGSLGVTGAVAAGGAITTTSGGLAVTGDMTTTSGNIDTAAGNLSCRALSTGASPLVVKAVDGQMGLIVRSDSPSDGTYTSTTRLVVGGGLGGTEHQEQGKNTLVVKEVTGNNGLTGSAPATVAIQDTDGATRIKMTANKSPLATSTDTAGTVVKIRGASGQTEAQLQIVNDGSNQYIKARANADVTGTHLELKAKSGQTGSILKILDSTGATKFEINADGSATGIPFAYGKATAGSTANTTGVSAVAQETMNGNPNHMLKITFATPRANSNYGVMIEPYNYNDTTPSQRQYTYQIVQKHTQFFRVALTSEAEVGSNNNNYSLSHTSVNNINFQCTDAP